MSKVKPRKIPQMKPDAIQPPSINTDYNAFTKVSTNEKEPKEEATKKTDGPKISFFKVIGLIMQGKKDTGNHMILGLMSIPLFLIFKLLSIVGFISIPVGIFTIVKLCISATWSGWNIITNIFTILIYVMLFFIIFLFSIMIWGASYEIEKTEDKHFVAAIFSGVVSLVALVVSLIALKR